MLRTNEKKELSRKSPEKAPAILSRVNQLVSQGLQQAAIDLLDAAVSASPNDSSLLSALGRVYLLNRQPEKAVIYLRRSLAQSSSKPVQANSYASVDFRCLVSRIVLTKAMNCLSLGARSVKLDGYRV